MKPRILSDNIAQRPSAFDEIAKRNMLAARLDPTAKSRATF